MKITLVAGMLLITMSLHAMPLVGLEGKILDYHGPTQASPFKAELLISDHVPSYLRILVDGTRGVAEVRSLEDNGVQLTESHFCGTQDVQWMAPTFSKSRGLVIKCLKDGDTYTFSVPDATREKPVGNRFFLAGVRNDKNNQKAPEWFWISANFKIHNSR